MTIGHPLEIDALRIVKPKRILISYWYERRRASIPELVEKLGYQPEIFYDCGAFSAMSHNTTIDLQTYVDQVKLRMPYLTQYASLDVIDDPVATWFNWQAMLDQGLYDAIPTFHYGEDSKYLHRYIKHGAKYIALGGAARRNKGLIAEWVRGIKVSHPGIKFHLFGSTSVKEADSGDSTTYVLAATIRKSPKHIIGTDPEAKLARTVWNLQDISNRFHSVEVTL